MPHEGPHGRGWGSPYITPSWPLRLYWVPFRTTTNDRLGTALAWPCSPSPQSKALISNHGRGQTRRLRSKPWLRTQTSVGGASVRVSRRQQLPLSTHPQQALNNHLEISVRQRTGGWAGYVRWPYHLGTRPCPTIPHMNGHCHF